MTKRDLLKVIDQRGNGQASQISGTMLSVRDYALAAHELAGKYHSGTLAPSQAPWAVMNDGSRSLLGANAFIGPTARLDDDLSNTDTTIYLSVNDWLNGDVIRIVSGANSEWMRLTSDASGDGPYAYTVTRDIASRAALPWTTGDAVANYGHTGSAWIAIYSGEDDLNPVGPTIASAIRTGDGWNSARDLWALGNLKNRYGYTDETIGIALGQYAQDEVWQSLDSRNGLRMMLGSLCLGQWTPYGQVISGSAEGGLHIVVDGSRGRISFKDKATELAAFDATTLSMIGWQRWGIPLGPCLEAGVVKDVDANGDPLLDANGIPQERYTLRMLAENGVPVIGWWSGTQLNPWNAAFRVGAADAGEYLDYRDGAITLSGVIHAQGGTFDGTVAIEGSGQLTWADAKGALNSTGLAYDQDANNYFHVAYTEGATSGIILRSKSTYAGGYTALFESVDSSVGVCGYSSGSSAGVRAACTGSGYALVAAGSGTGTTAVVSSSSKSALWAYTGALPGGAEAAITAEALFGATALKVIGGVVDGGSQRYTALADATADTDALNRQTGDARYAPMAAADHGGLTGLGDDDHSQYLLATGARTGASSADQKFGNVAGGNYLQIATDGTVQLFGAATAWDDLRVAGSMVRAGATAPTLGAFGPSGSLKTYRFDAGQHDEVHFEIQMPHNWRQGSAIYPHVHWAPVSATAGNVVWELEYTWASIGGTFGAPSNMASDATAAGGTAWVHKLSQLKDLSGNAYIDGTGQTFSSMLVCRLHRNAGSGSDTLAADVAFLEFDLHYEVDAFGSIEEYSKYTGWALDFSSVEHAAYAALL